MTQPLPFEDETFDIIFHPVSNCYVEEVIPIWKECYRILKYGGHLIAGTDHYVNYLVDEKEERIINHIKKRWYLCNIKEEGLTNNY